MLSRGQIDCLGDRLRTGDLEPGDDGLLAEFLLSFRDFAERTFNEIASSLIQAVLTTERSVKSSQAIAEKLRRERSLRLEQIQDIVGCRIVATSTSAQDEIVGILTSTFTGSDVRDRRSVPVNGYRAVHVIIRDGRLRYEVQVRTRIQHIWASIVESLIGVYGIDVKYGGGGSDIQNRLQALSSAIAQHEAHPTDASLVSSIEESIDRFDSLIGEKA